MKSDVRSLSPKNTLSMSPRSVNNSSIVIGNSKLFVKSALRMVRRLVHRILQRCRLQSAMGIISHSIQLYSHLHSHSHNSLKLLLLLLVVLVFYNF